MNDLLESPVQTLDKVDQIGRWQFPLQFNRPIVVGKCESG